MGLFQKKYYLSDDQRRWNAIWDLWAEEKARSPYAELMTYQSEMDHGGHEDYFENMVKIGNLPYEISVLEQILPRHIDRWDNMKLKNWHTNISATKYYARVRPRKIPEMLQKAMKLTDAEVETYFGDVLRLLEVTNARPEE